MKQTFDTISMDGTPFENLSVRMIDQLRLPTEEVYVVAQTGEEVATAIETMIIRGAPAIGVAAAMGLALGFERVVAKSKGRMESKVVKAEWTALKDRMGRTRPTAVNLFWAIGRMDDVFERALPSAGADLFGLAKVLVKEAQDIAQQDVALCRSIGQHGASLVPADARILTHCNAGALATAGYGTALGVIRGAVEAGKKVHVFCDETRPYLQGARLTAWELVKDQIPATLITDNMAAHMMKTQKIDLVVVGADRIARNGDTANKIGTYGLAILCQYHKIPFYVAAPSSTFDLQIKNGTLIPIEERSRDEVVRVGTKVLAPEGVQVRHPGFDVTPAELITAIVTERGVIKPVNEDNVCKLIG